MPNIDLVDRYDRQQLIEGWNQEKIEQGIVTIVGSGNLALYTALPLSALGVGVIRLIDTAAGAEDDMLIDMSLEGAVKTQKLEEKLKRINPNVEIIGINSELSSITSQYFLEGSNIVIDTTNNVVSKSHTADFCHREKVPFISASANEKRGKTAFQLFSNQCPQDIELMPMFNESVQSDLVSIVLGGVIAEEVKKVLLNESPNKLCKKVYDYNLESNNRFNYKKDINIKDSIGAFRDKNILVVGAGALGCFLGPAIAKNLVPKRIDIMDFDVVEGHNLNRQVCYYDSVGQLKAKALSKKLRKIVKNKTEIRSLIDRFTEDFKPKIKYDLIFDAVDSFQTKAILHNFAMKNRMPLISGGTDYRAATVLTYVPAQTSCFNCQINLDQLAIKAEIIRRTSCIQAPDPSVIMTNQIAGGIMAAEARRVLRPDIYGTPTNGEIKYIADFDSRGGVSSKQYICDCHIKEIKRLELPHPERIRIEEREDNGKTWREVYVDGRKI